MATQPYIQKRMVQPTRPVGPTMDPKFGIPVSGPPAAMGKMAPMGGAPVDPSLLAQRDPMRAPAPAPVKPERYRAAIENRLRQAQASVSRPLPTQPRR